MASIKTISAALKLIDSKKENLRKAFDGLQAHSPSLPSFTLTWSDIDSYFTSIQSSLERKFDLLQSEEAQPPLPKQIQSSSSSSAVVVQNSSNPSPVQAWPEVKSLCENMNGLGLRRFIVARHNRRASIRVELPGALRCAPDAAAMILDAMEGFYRPHTKGNGRDPKLYATRMACMVLFEELLQMKAEIKPEVRVRAMNLALEWKGKASVDGENPLEALGFVNLLATYGLMDDFNVEELIDFAVAIARFRQASELYRVLGFGDRISGNCLRRFVKYGFLCSFAILLHTLLVSGLWCYSFISVYPCLVSAAGSLHGCKL